MEFLKFIFSSFWTWLGFLILLSAAAGAVKYALEGLGELVKACKRNRKVEACRVGEHWSVSVENASKEDAMNALLAAHVGADDPVEMLENDKKGAAWE